MNKGNLVSYKKILTSIIMKIKHPVANAKFNSCIYRILYNIITVLQIFLRDKISKRQHAL